jgi:Protein of unknown function (DUF3307)
MALIIAWLGGIFAILSFIHFFVDWIFQSHAEAMVKHNNPKVRAKHCLIYTLGFAPLFWLVHFTAIEWVIGLNVLFWSHFAEDTYIPVYLWARYIRKPPEMTQPRKEIGADGHIIMLPPDPKAGFAEFIQTSLGKILMITIDQLVHLTFLFPIAWMILNHVVRLSCSMH